MTTAGTLTLTDFLLARIAEDEEWARARGGPVAVLAGALRETVDVPVYGDDPLAKRVLAECEAKRKVVEKYLNWCEPETTGPNAGLGLPRGDTWAEATRTETKAVLYILANVYADRPDFRDEWRL